MMDRFQKAWGWHTLKILIVLKKSGGKKDKYHCIERPFFQTSLLHSRIVYKVLLSIGFSLPEKLGYTCSVC